MMCYLIVPGVTWSERGLCVYLEGQLQSVTKIY